MSRSLVPPPKSLLFFLPLRREVALSDHLAHWYCFESTPPSVGRGQAESEGIVLVAYAESVDPASALGDSKLCINGSEPSGRTQPEVDFCLGS